MSPDQWGHRGDVGFWGLLCYGECKLRTNWGEYKILNNIRDKELKGVGEGERRQEDTTQKAGLGCGRIWRGLEDEFWSRMRKKKKEDFKYCCELQIGLLLWSLGKNVKDGNYSCRNFGQWTLFLSM